MKRYLITISIFLFLFATVSMADNYPKSSFRLYFGGWASDGKLGIRMNHQDIGNNEGITNVEFSAGLAFSHMIGQRFAWEISTGGLTDNQRRTSHKDYDAITHKKTDSVSVSYIAAGLLYYPLAELSHFRPDTFHNINSVIRPYMVAGLGSYFGMDVTVHQDDIEDAHVDVTNGGFVGVGFDLAMSRNFLFNLDLRYHFVEYDKLLNDQSDYSGTNILAGFKIAF